MINLYLCAQTINNTMKRNLLLLLSILFLSVCGTLQACCIGLLYLCVKLRFQFLIERQDNRVVYVAFECKMSSRSLDEVVLNFGKDVNMADIQSVKLYYSGTEARQNYGKKFFTPVSYISSHTPGKTLAANPSYSINNHR